MKEPRLLFLIALFVFSSLSISLAQVSPELAPIRSAKNQTEANTDMILKSWNKESEYYTPALFKYNELLGTFSGTVEYMNSYFSYGKSKQKKNASEFKAKVVELVELTMLYNNYLKENHVKAVAVRGGPEVTVIAVQSGIEIAEQVMTYFSDNRKKKMDSIKEELATLNLKPLDQYVTE